MTDRLSEHMLVNQDEDDIGRASMKRDEEERRKLRREQQEESDTERGR